jgi:hypothetical protein
MESHFVFFHSFFLPMNSYPHHLLSHMGTRNRQSIWRIFLNTFWRAFFKLFAKFSAAACAVGI